MTTDKSKRRVQCVRSLGTRGSIPGPVSALESTNRRQIPVLGNRSRSGTGGHLASQSSCTPRSDPVP